MTNSADHANSAGSTLFAKAGQQDQVYQLTFESVSYIASFVSSFWTSQINKVELSHHIVSYICKEYIDWIGSSG